MFRYEASVCRAVRKVLAVSEADAAAMRRMYGIADVPAVPTGVDLEYFAPPPPPRRRSPTCASWAPWTGCPTWMARSGSFVRCCR